MKVYVASSWRNTDQIDIVQTLRDQGGHEVYDFRNPSPGNTGFHWTEIDPSWKSRTKYRYRECLKDPIATKGFNIDFKAMKWADVFLGVQPFGRSASMEMGWAAGMGKSTILLLANGEPELMVKMFNHLCCNLDEVLSTLRTMERRISLGLDCDTGKDQTATVVMKGAKLVCVLPETRDPRDWELIDYNGDILAIHPDSKPVLMRDGKVIS